MKRYWILFVIACLGISSCTEKTESSSYDYTTYVDPFIGTAENGHTFPGACVPFGMVQPSPVTGAIGWRYCSEYQYTDSLLWGFTQTHLNGTGCMDLGDILMMPVAEGGTDSTGVYRSTFSKEHEMASPGYYSVMMDHPEVRVELTASTHVAMHRYTFAQQGPASMLIDLQHGPAWSEGQYHAQVNTCDIQWEDAYTLTGHVRNSVWVYQDYFFVLQFDHPTTAHTQLPLQGREKGKRLIASFDIPENEALMVKIALSTTSIEGARKNMKAEVDDWNFDRTVAAAKAAWNRYLSRAEMEGTDAEKTMFYTSLYHTLIQPNQISDTDGSYRNCKDEIVASTGSACYSTFSLWDTYRAAHPLYTLLVADKVDDFVNSLLDHGEAQGVLPIWALWGKDNYCMIGNHGVSVVAEAYRKGFHGFDAERAFDIVRRTQTISHPQKSDWDTYLHYGYFPCDLITKESVSSTLESVYDDYAAADMARRMGKHEEAAYFQRRAGFYRNLFDSETGFMRPRNADSTWKAPFNPNDVAHAESIGGDYTEGNAWQYTWHVQHDIPGLIQLLGGEEAFTAKLDSFFTLQLHTQAADVTGLIGQYAHGNEPSHHVAYLYTMAGKPRRTQELIRQIVSTQYLPHPDGLCGNDDCGQMSAWYLFSVMGFYPVDPVSGNYILGAPQLPQITLHLPQGKTLTIVAKGLSEKHQYVREVQLNGHPLERNYLTHEEICNGGTLVFTMTE